MYRRLSYLIAGLMVSSAAGALAQDQAAAPMITEARTSPSGQIEGEVAEIRASYERAYAEAGRPRIALFWNRKFDDQLTQWYAISRVTSTGGEPGSKAGVTVREERDDVRSRFDGRASPGELASFEFSAGLTRTLLASGTELVDRDMLMRLAQRRSPELVTGARVSDYQEIELDALIGSVDLIVEILYAGPADTYDPLTVMVSIREVETGRVVSMFRSREDVLPPARTEARWVPGEGGYTRIEVPVEDPVGIAADEGILAGSAEYLGWRTALQAMQALTRSWQG